MIEFVKNVTIHCKFDKPPIGGVKISN